MRVLIIESDATMASAIVRTLKAESITTEAAKSHAEGIEFVQALKYELVVLAIHNEGDLKAVRALRASKNKTPILALMGTPGAELRVQALDTGVDDCLAKPFDTTELLARMRALIRRSHGHADSSIVIGELSLVPHMKAVQLCGQPVKLRPREYRLLEFMALRKGRLLSKNEFVDGLYDGDGILETTVSTHICNLRKKLSGAAEGGEHYITTSHGYGYVLNEPKRGLAA